jgi:NDP-sugar pyrophosphorylase family protein
MKIIVPMSGYGQRFLDEGYSLPKPLIKVDGIPMIQHVSNLFDDDCKFLFICSEEHLDNNNYNMAEVLKRAVSNSEIIGIPSHKKGPVHAVLAAEHLIKVDEPCIINYCDFSCYWSWQDFLTYVQETECDGCIPAYKGFHPHSLNSTNYAYLRHDGEKVFDIQEKKPFTDQKMKEYASSGTYYFKSSYQMLAALKFAVENDLSTNGEYFISLAYHFLFKNKSDVRVFELEHFMQWGTPQDLEEYLYWSHTFRMLVSGEPRSSSYINNLIMPLAGAGSRFADAGWVVPKPLIEVYQEPMAKTAIKALPLAKQYSFVTRHNEDASYDFNEKIFSSFDNYRTASLSNVTAGQALTASIGVSLLPEHEGDVTICACDSALLYDADAYFELLNQESYDVIVWTAASYPYAKANPKAYGWVTANSKNVVQEVAVKSLPKQIDKAKVITGTFSFANTSTLMKLLAAALENKTTVKSEYYLDSLLEMALEEGLRVVAFDVDAFVSWGTPEELNTFKYWQECFDKWKWHPYSRSNDWLAQR